ncbi:MAG: hypothetical protein WC876_07015 [Candidatus Thermoplasmatota archaeon]|jgi:hypothetical protein
MRIPTPLALLLLALPLAGCLGDGSTPGSATALSFGPDELQEGAFYAFHHDGGELAFAMAENGSAEVELYSADDRRVGRIGFGADQGSGSFVLEGIDGGDVVVQILSVNGTLDLRSAGRPVESFALLGPHVERHVLVQQPRAGITAPIGLGLADNPIDETVEIELLRAPAALNLVFSGSFSNLDVRVTSSTGTVLETEDGGSGSVPLQNFGGVIAAETRMQNVRDGRLTAHITADGFEGVLLLEAYSFSRAAAPSVPVEAVDGVARFTYGALPDQPVAFQVRDGAQSLYLWQEAADLEACAGEGTIDTGASTAEDCPSAVVALFDGNDQRFATVQVPAKGTLRIPVSEPGDYVAVLLYGQATLGADRVPTDFELHPLEVVTATAPERAPSSDGQYEQVREPMQAVGVPFSLRPERGSDNDLIPLPSAEGCDDGTLSVLQAGETVYYYGMQGEAGGDGRWLSGGELEVVYDTYGMDCGSVPQVAIDGYQR